MLDRVFKETVKIASKLSIETDVLKASKIESALSILAIASTIATEDKGKAQRLITLANNVAN